jgi:hypothetical protein
VETGLRNNGVPAPPNAKPAARFACHNAAMALELNYAKMTQF